jgi:hypothetical protein
MTTCYNLLITYCKNLMIYAFQKIPLLMLLPPYIDKNWI